MTQTDALLQEIYARLLAHFGPQHWWPGETPFEVIVGAILTQNTNWQNVERAMANLQSAGCLDPRALYALPPDRLARLIQPAGYYNIKTKRLRNFLRYFLETYEGDIEVMRRQTPEQMRKELLAVSGIGPETADSIMLYALGHPVFVIDAYTHRVLQRHHLAPDEATYDELQELFMDHLPAHAEHYNEFHALFVTVGKHFCRPNAPACEACPLGGLNWK